MQTEKDYVKDLGTVVEVSWSKPCYVKCFPTKKHHADKWQQQKIQHEKQTALFCSLLPWSPSHVDRNKKKCLWKLFLFPSSKCCILGSTPVCKGFSWLPCLWQTLFAVRQPWRHWWRISHDPALYFVLFFPSYWVMVTHTLLEFAPGLKSCVWVPFQKLGLELCWGACVAHGLLFCKKSLR